MKVCIWDLSKAYNQIVTGEDELYMRRLVWRWGKEDDQLTVYGHGFSRVHFNDLPATPIPRAHQEERRKKKTSWGEILTQTLLTRWRKATWKMATVAGMKR